MEKILKLYTYIDGVNDSKFPNDENQIEIYDFTYDVKRMGGAPTISATVMYPTCLDDVWADQVYAEFNGEKYFLKQTPTSSFSNKDVRYKHEVELVSERIILDNVYFYDVVSDDADDYKPVTNSSKVTFHGDIHEFANRLKYSLKKSGVGYDVVVDEGITSEEKLISFEKQFFSNVLQEIYNTYELPYYFVGKTIHIGYTDNTITEVFEYGVENSLLSIKKTNSNNKIVNRITGVGSSENIPYYYPNETEKGEISAIVENGDFEVEVINQSLYAKKVDMTIDANDILESSRVIYKSGSGNFAHFYTSTDGKTWSNSTNFNLTMDNYQPLRIYLKYEVLVFNSGIIQFNPKVEYNKNLIENNEEVECWYYIDDKEQEKINIYAKGGVFEADIKGKDSGSSYIKYNFIFLYSIHYKGVNEYNFNIESGYKGFISTWYNVNKRIELSDIGVRIDESFVLKNGYSFYQLRTSEYIKPQPSLMPSIYRESIGNEMFYNAINRTYKDENGNYYVFNNPYLDGKPKEHIEDFADIKPTITGMELNGYRIDMFSEFAYDTNDNDETEEDENGNLVYKHPYFFGKLRKLDFNLFDHAIESGEMTISMTSGHCGACKFVIGVDSENQENKVQVDENGNLLRDDFGDVRCGRKGKQGETPQPNQNNTINNEVWIALKKDIDTFGTIMPNNVSKPTTDDTFVILNILLPKSYIINAEKKLDKALINYMSLNNDEIFNFSIDFSRIYLAENENVLKKLNENARLTILYNGKETQLYISSYSYKMSASSPLPEIKVELVDELSVHQNAIQNTISSVKEEIISNITSIDILATGLPYFVRKDIDDYINGVLRYKKGLEIGEYTSGILGTGGSFKVDEKGNSHIEADYLTIRKKATFNEIAIQELKHIGGQLILSPAAIMCSKVEEKEDSYYCYFETADDDGREIFNEFIENDQARCQTFNIAGGSRYYWRLVTSVGRNYIVLSKEDCDEGSDIPQAGDNIVQLGHRNIIERQNAQILSSYGEGSPYYTQYVGIDSYSLEGKEQTRISPNGNLFTGKVKIQPNSEGLGNFSDLPEEINKAVQVGGDNILRNSGFTGDYENIDVESSSKITVNTEVYSSRFEFWEGAAARVEEPKAGSGYAAMFATSLSQEVDLLLTENYVISFYVKGNSNTAYSVKCGGAEFKNFIAFPNYYNKQVLKFRCTSKEKFEIIGDLTVYDLKLERGTIPTDWTPSVLDNDKVADNFKHLQYISDSIRNGRTDILGGLILSSMLKVGLYKDGVLQRVTAGVNGNYFNEDSVAFWAGGTLKDAINTVTKFSQGIIPTEEDWKGMANFVATHGGDVFMRGYLNALGISLRGKIESAVGQHKLVIDPENQKISAYAGGQEVLKIDYANRIFSMIGYDCERDPDVCYMQSFRLDGVGLKFENGASYGTFGASVDYLSATSVNATSVNASNIVARNDNGTGNIQANRCAADRFDLHIGEPDSIAIAPCLLYVDDNGYVRALRT